LQRHREVGLWRYRSLFPWCPYRLCGSIHAYIAAFFIEGKV
jgi:hypothetical protein